jgi:hypothetical protein
VLLLLQFDTVAETVSPGVAVLAALVVQAVVPLALALRVFRRKDF